GLVRALLPFAALLARETDHGNMARDNTPGYPWPSLRGLDNRYLDRERRLGQRDGPVPGFRSALADLRAQDGRQLQDEFLVALVLRPGQAQPVLEIVGHGLEQARPVAHAHLVPAQA